MTLSITLLSIISLFVISANTASVRFFQSLPGYTVDISAPPFPDIFQLGFGQATPYTPATDGAYTIQVFSGGNVLTQGEVPVNGLVYYTFAPIYFNGQFMIHTFFEDLQGAQLWQEGDALLRFIHLAHNQEEVTITMGTENVLVRNARHLTDSTFFPMPSNTSIVLSVTIGNFSFEYSAGILQPNTLYSLIMVSTSLNNETSPNTLSDINMLLIKDRCHVNYTCLNPNNGGNGTTGNSTESNSTLTTQGMMTSGRITTGSMARATTGATLTQMTITGTNTNTNTNTDTQTTAQQASTTNPLSNIEDDSASGVAASLLFTVVMVVALL